MAAPVFEGLSEHVGSDDVEQLSRIVYAMPVEEVLTCIEYFEDPEVPGYYLIPDGKVVESVSYGALVEAARRRKLAELYTQVHVARIGKMSRYVTARMETSGEQAVA